MLGGRGGSGKSWLTGEHGPVDESKAILIDADAVNYRTKSAEFAARAKRLLQLYKDHMGLKEDDTATPAAAVADHDEKYPGGFERLTHPRWTRRLR